MQIVPQMIMQMCNDHKSGNVLPVGLGRRLMAALTALLCLGLWGCADNGADDNNGTPDTAREISSEQSSPAGRTIQDAPVTVSTAALDKWLLLAKRVQEGATVRESEYEQLLNMPAYDQIRKTEQGRFLSAGIMSNVVKYAFAPRDESGNRIWTGRIPKRKSVLVNYMYASDHLDDLSALSADLKASDLGNRVYALLATYLPANRLPKALTLHFMMATNVISIYGDSDVYIDAGLVLASKRSNLHHMIAADIYRSLSGMNDALPSGAPDGESALKLTFRKIRLEGIAAWIGRLPEIVFSEDYEYLAKNNQYHVDIVPKAQKIIGDMGVNLDMILDPEKDILSIGGTNIDDLLRLSKGYPRVGYAMSALIVDQAGEAAFIEASKSTRSFLIAYQDAALTGKGTYELGDLPPFPEASFKRVLELVSGN